MRERRMTAALAALLALSVMGFAQPQRKQTDADKQAGKNTANKERRRRTEEGGPVTPKTVEHALITGGEVRRTIKGDESIVVAHGHVRRAGRPWSSFRRMTAISACIRRTSGTG